MRERIGAGFRAIGFWCGHLRAGVPPDDPRLQRLAQEHEVEIQFGRVRLPHPSQLIRILGTRSYDARILDYVATGVRIASYFGFGVCRCCGAELGVSDLTDGTWVWPQGFDHYLSAHELPLPEAFLRTIAENDFRIPPRVVPTFGAVRSEPDFTFWHSWTAAVYKAGGE